MAVTVHVGRVLAKLHLDGGRVAAAVAEIPLLNDVDALAARLDGAVFAKEVKGFLQVVGIDVGGALHDAIGPAFKAHQREPQVLGLNIGMVEVVGVGHDLGHAVAQHPAQQVDAVDALVHQRPAVHGPGAAPGGLSVVFLAPVPAHVHRAVQHAPEALFLHGGADLLNGFVEAVLVTCAQLESPRIRFGNQRARIRQRQGQRLFDDHIGTRTQHIQPHLCVQAAFGGHGAQLRRLFDKQLAMVRIAAHAGAVLLRQGPKHSLHAFGNGVTYGAQLQILRVVQICRDVVGRDSPAPDERIAQFFPHDEAASPFAAHRTRMFSRFFTFFMAFLVSKIRLACSATKS